MRVNTYSIGKLLVSSEFLIGSLIPKCYLLFWFIQQACIELIKSDSFHPKK